MGEYISEDVLKFLNGNGLLKAMQVDKILQEINRPEEVRRVGLMLGPHEQWAVEEVQEYSLTQGWRRPKCMLLDQARDHYDGRMPKDPTSYYDIWGDFIYEWEQGNANFPTPSESSRDVIGGTM